MGMTVMLEV